MDIYDLIQDLQSFNPDMSEYPKITRRGLALGNFREGYVTPVATKEKLRQAMLLREQDPKWIARKADIASKVAASLTGKPSPKKGIPISEESKQKMREAARPSISEEQKRKTSETMKKRVADYGLPFRPKSGGDNNRARRCQCIQTGKMYDTLVECAKDNNVTVRTVQNWCKKEAKTTTNGQWNGLSFRYID